MSAARAGTRAGFSFVELLVVIAVLSLLAGLSVPKYHELRKRATAARAISAMMVVRQAAYAHNEATGHWPDGDATGAVPAELVRYLPSGFRFSQPDFQLTWRYSGFLSGTQLSVQLAQVNVQDPVLCQQVSNLLGGGKNPDVLSFCGGSTGIVQLYIDN